jgi:hypothetical protein
VPILHRLDRSSKVAHQRPEPAEDGTRFPEFPWDLRTIILLFPPEAPFRFMNLNLLLGLTGAPFDQPEQLGPLDPQDAFDLQFCLEGRKQCATYKRYHSITQDLSYRPAAVKFLLGERLRFEGQVPLRTFRYEVLQLQARTENTDGLALSLSTEGPLGMELKKSGVLRWGREHSQVMNRYECRVLEWETFENYAGAPCRVPRRWLGRQTGSGVELEYEAQRSTEPRAVLGNGFLSGFDYQGVWKGPVERAVQGEGYSEQLGRFYVK